MDFPLDLTKSWVDNTDELEQTVVLILKNRMGEFIQSPTIGLALSVHSSDLHLLEEGVRATIDQLKGVTLDNVEIRRTEEFNITIDLRISYRGDFLNILVQI